MRKFTNFILLFSAFSLLSTHISAQNADIELLRTINSSTKTMDYSRFISNTTTEVAIGVPVIMGAMALIEKDDDLLKNAIYVSVSIGVDGVLTYGLKHSFNRPRPYVTYPDIVVTKQKLQCSFLQGILRLHLPLPHP